MGVLEICLPRQPSLDDLYMGDALSHICGLLISKFADSRKQISRNSHYKKLIDSYAKLQQHSKNMTQFTNCIEMLVKDLFGTQCVKFIFVKNDKCYWHTND